MEMSEEIKQMLDENIVYLATSTKGGRPNVVPIGLAHAMSDNEVLIVDVLFKKTRKNLEGNPQVAISFTDVKRLESYQLKGEAKISEMHKRLRPKAAVLITIEEIYSHIPKVVERK
jgi:predicted pyridoxine 5'-phosphate oxidase superfamily flavin-nucleotide-binding protein